MKKLMHLILSLFIIISLSACSKNDKDSVLNKIENNINKSKGYQLTAVMELINNEDSYKYDVTASYKKDNLYRVSLRNKSNNHEQIILKNEDGVYVLTPALNKSFKFQSKWPNNNSQSYLLQSILNDMKSDDNLKFKSTKDYYIFTSKVNYKNNNNLTHQEIYFDKNYKIKKVIVIDKDEVAAIKVKFNEVEMKAKFDKNYFDLDDNMETDEEYTIEDLTEPVYPMYLPEGSYLESEKVVELDEGNRIMMTFSGDSSFMLIEEAAVKQDELSIIPTSGDLDIFADSVAIIDDNSINWMDNGTSYYLVSSDCDINELIQVAKSIATLPVGK